MRSNANHKLVPALALFCALAAALTGCGGGGGGGGNPGTGAPVTVKGTVLSVESGLPATAGATVTIGGQTTTTDTTGKFTLANVSSGTTSGTVTAASEMPLTLALALKATGVTDLGTLYLSNAGYTATVSGRVVTTVGGATQPVGNATVTIGTATTKSGTDGTFTLKNLPIGLGANAGIVGKIDAVGFDEKAITQDTLRFPLAAGANNIGDISVAQPSGSVPAAPFTIQGIVTVRGAAAANIPVTLASGGISLGSTTTDSTGTYSFWVVPATYTISATSTATQSVTVTLLRLDTPVTAPQIVLP